MHCFHLYAKSHSPIYAWTDFGDIKDFSVNRKNGFCLKLFHWKFDYRYNSTEMKLFIKYCISIVFGFALLIYGSIKSISLIKLKWPQKKYDAKPSIWKESLVFGWLIQPTENQSYVKWTANDSQLCVVWLLAEIINTPRTFFHSRLSIYMWYLMKRFFIFCCGLMK